MNGTRGTFSIVAADLEAGDVGCAVQSKYFAVGSVVPWARAGVGAAATQASGVAAYGSQALDLLAAGSSPDEALERVLAHDDRRETRQLGLVTADGRAAAITGRECLDWAGHRVGGGFAVQGNILAGQGVVDGMARAFEETSGPLVDRLVAALEAGQAAGGDKRGQQSAAIVVERTGAAATSREAIERICELRVEDHREPIVELRRLLGIWHRHAALESGMGRYETGDYSAAADELAAALDSWGEDALLLYNLACCEALAGRREAALAHLRRATELESSYRELAASDSDLESIRDGVEAAARG